MSTKSTRGKEAITRFRVLQRLGVYSHLEVFPKTGRTHQIRVHLSEAGFPIVGDTLYGGRFRTPHPLLHAKSIEFDHPKTLERMCIAAPLSEAFQNELKALKLSDAH